MLRPVRAVELIRVQAAGGKNKKDMASYKFWATQPVARFGMKFVSAGSFSGWLLIGGR